MKIIFFGTPAFAADYLAALINDPFFDVVGVVTQPDEPVGRKKILTPPPTKTLATAHGIPVFQPTKLKDPDVAAMLRAREADLFVVIAYGRILPQTVLDIPPQGVVNVHPSLLPELRGPSPIATAVAQGRSTTGISIMLLDAEMDHGPLLAQTPLTMATDETTETLTKKIVDVGAPLLRATLKNIATITPVAQRHEDATFCRLLTREDSAIDWHLPAEVIDAQIRAYNPWPGTSTAWLRNDAPLTLKLFASRIGSTRLTPGTVQIDGDRLLIGTSTTALIVDELQPAAGKRMTAAAFIQGYGAINGATLG